MKALLLENIDQEAVRLLKQQGYEVDHRMCALDGDELVEAAKDCSLLGIRSRTPVNAYVLKSLNRLSAVGVFGIGTNLVDLDTCSEFGIPVFNAPYSNTRSVVELVIGCMVMLARRSFAKSTLMHDGVWQKSAAGCFELRGKRLGIGSQLSVLAENFGMDVYFYDLVDKLQLGNATQCKTMKELLSTVDVVTLHVDGRSENDYLIGKRELNQMKSGSIFLNLSRGRVVNTSALADAIKSGHIAGAACDVYEVEPKSNDDPFVSELRGLDNVILTPHIGAATQEAQKRIAEFVSNKFEQYMCHGDTTLSCNFPNNQLMRKNGGKRFVHVHRNVPGVLAKINHILSVHGLNIEGQSLQTNRDVGYVITDAHGRISKKIIDKLSTVDGTIRVRNV